jgi:ADP-L-glycero-D-manno-heptose 6-epimerase
MKCLVTGATGFIGKAIAQRLARDGHTVVGTSSSGAPAPYCSQVLNVGLNGIDWRRLEGVEVVFHQAANNDTRCQDWADMRHTNVDASVKLFDEAWKAGCRKFVYASSTAVYGNEPGPYDEDKTPLSGTLPYARSKIEMEKALNGSIEQKGLTLVGLRYCNVFGPGESHKGKRMSMIGQMLEHALQKKPISLFFDGSQKRDWVYIDDVVEANLKAAECGQSMVCNIGTGVATSFLDLWNYITDVTDFKSPPNWLHNPFNDDYQSHTQCRNELACKALGWLPHFSVRQGINAYLHRLTAA